MKDLTAIVLTKNSQDTIKRCLESLMWVGEILVVDSFSTDQTLEICRAYTDKILQHPYSNYGEQLNWALQKVSTPWVLVIDSDEEVTPALKEEIQSLFKGGEMLDGYYLPRKSFFLGRWLSHGGWYPDYVLRLFQKGRGKYKERELGSTILLRGEKGYLRGDILHRPYRDLSHYLEKFNYYTDRASEEYKKRGKRVGWWDLLLRPPLRFFKMYVLKKGFLDGRQGFILAVVSSFYVFFKYARTWEKLKGENPRDNHG